MKKGKSKYQWEKVMKEMIFELFKNKPNRTAINIIINNKSLIAWIKQYTQYLPNNVTLGQRLWHLIHDIQEIPKCNVCGKNTKFNNFNIGYREYCSVKCRAVNNKGRIPWNKGKNGYTTSRKGMKQSEETKEKIRQKKKGQISPKKGKSKYRLFDLTQIIHCQCGCGGRILLKGYHRRYGTPKFIQGHNFKTIKQREQNSKNALNRIFPLKDTSIEIALQEALKKEGFGFETHKSIFGQPDIFIKPNYCIFADGDYWHNYPNGRDRDKQVNEVLEKNGYKILRFWEREINNNLDNCIEKIKEVMK